MNGHFLSIDGLIMWRQATSLVYHGSWSLSPTVWWGDYVRSSYRGVGASLQYVPGLFALDWLSGHLPVQAGPHYDFKLFYGDILYILSGAPLWALVTAVTAYLVGLTARVLGGDHKQALWAMAFYGLGSPAFAASRGDWPQPLVAICWAAGAYGCLRYLNDRRGRWLWLAGIAVFYGVLTRPLEGSLLLPAELILLLPLIRRNPGAGGSQIGAWAVGIGVTMLTNWARFGGPLNFGYAQSQEAWTTPIWIGLPGDVVSPGRGILWEFPALVIALVGLVYLWRRRDRWIAIALGGLPAVLLVEASLYVDWVGGWDWGFRFFQPALPLLAGVAGVGVVALPRALRLWLPAVVLGVGLIWNAPVILTDLLAGYGAAYADGAANFRLDAYPPIGAWRFLHHLRPQSGLDSAGIDLVWLRAYTYVGPLALVPFVLLIAGAAVLWRRTWRELRRV